VKWKAGRTVNIIKCFSLSPPDGLMIDPRKSLAIGLALIGINKKNSGWNND
jgi:hypothetical protein